MLTAMYGIGPTEVLLALVVIGIVLYFMRSKTK